MSTIYIVMGRTGEYSDSQEWIVCAYKSEAAAQARVIELETLMKTVGAVTDISWDERCKAEDAMRKHQDGDEYFMIDYTGTRYTYESAELKDG